MPERASLRDLIEFAGWPTIRAICLLWAFGLIHLLLELGFAYLLQRFLFALGLISTQSLNGSWLGLDLSLNKIIFHFFTPPSCAALASRGRRPAWSKEGSHIECAAAMKPPNQTPSDRRDFDLFKTNIYGHPAVRRSEPHLAGTFISVVVAFLD